MHASVQRQHLREGFPLPFVYGGPDQGGSTYWSVLEPIHAVCFVLVQAKREHCTREHLGYGYGEA